MSSSQRHVIISSVLVIFLTLLTACSSGSTGGSAGNTTGNTGVPSTATSVPGLTFKGDVHGLMVSDGTCDYQDLQQIQWHGGEIRDDATQTETFIIFNVLFQNYQGPNRIYPLVPAFTTSTSVGDATIELRTVDFVTFQVTNDASNSIFVGANGKSGTIHANLVNIHDPTSTVAITGSWSCMIAG